MVKILDQKNSRKQGDVGMGMAIGYFTSLGWTVSLPLTDSQEYDLVIDYGNGLKKVQIKTTRYIENNKNGGKHYRINLKTCGGNRSGIGKIKKFDHKKVDFLFILTEINTMYLLPTDCFNAVSTLTLYNKYIGYIVTMGRCPSQVEGA